MQQHKKVLLTIMLFMVIVVSFVGIFAFFAFKSVVFFFHGGSTFSSRQMKQVVSLIHSGQDYMEYKKINKILVGGEAGHEDVLFFLPGESKEDGYYRHTGRLYSEDDKCDIASGMYDIEIVGYHDDNWYDVKTTLYP